jgi:dihydroxy-acid dehydratase
MPKFNKKKLPSRHTSLGADRAPHRSFYYAMGETEKDVSKPFVGVCIKLGMKQLLVILL